MREAVRLGCLLVLFSFSDAFMVDDSIHYVISFRNSEPVNELDDKKLDTHLAGDANDAVTLIAREGGTYSCSLPDISSRSGPSLDGYTGPTPWELVGRLKAANVCSKRYDVYWAYEVCHGKYVMQFHEDKLRRDEYYLGNFNQNYITIKVDLSNPEKVRHEDEDLAVLPILYSQGTVCDITGKPRTARVLYACFPGAREVMKWVRETSSCNYDVLVLTDVLCSHPTFAPSHLAPHDIVCTLQAAPRSNPRPFALPSMEDHHKIQFKKQYALIAEDNESSGRAITTDSDLLNSLYAEMEEKKLENTGVLIGPGSSGRGGDSTGDIHLALTFSTDRILSGDECIEGGAGWWKYELCFGIQVTQFHEEGSERTTVVLGSFDRDAHRAWIVAKPQKKPVYYADEVVQVSHFYGNGDECSETGQRRSVEVRVRCARSHRSRMAVSISLSEPTICNYILTVEGERFCDSLQTVDKFGLLPEEYKGVQGYLGTEEAEEEEDHFLRIR